MRSGRRGLHDRACVAQRFDRSERGFLEFLDFPVRRRFTAAVVPVVKGSGFETSCMPGRERPVVVAGVVARPVGHSGE